MRRRVVSIILTIVLMGLILPGCVPDTVLDDCQLVVSEQSAQITELASKVAELTSQTTKLTSQMADLDATIQAKDAEITEQAAQINELKLEVPKINEDAQTVLPKKTGDTAKIELTFRPNPLVLNNGQWYVRIIFTEVNGIGVKLEKIVWRYHSESGFAGSWWTYKPDEDEGYMDSYLLPYSTAGFMTGMGYRHDRGVNLLRYVECIVTGVDDNGNKIRAEGRTK